jgi:hypothetical protein
MGIDTGMTLDRDIRLARREGFVGLGIFGRARTLQYVRG